MTDKRTQQEAENSNMAKDPDEWVTGDEAMTGAQRSYLKTLSEEAHEPFDANLTKAEASKRIEELQRKTGRGTDESEESRSALEHLSFSLVLFLAIPSRPKMPAYCRQ
jgi:Protein of unknown function (DUF3072)